MACSGYENGDGRPCDDTCDDDVTVKNETSDVDDDPGINEETVAHGTADMNERAENTSVYEHLQ